MISDDIPGLSRGPAAVSESVASSSIAPRLLPAPSRLGLTGLSLLPGLCLLPSFPPSFPPRLELLGTLQLHRGLSQGPLLETAALTKGAGAKCFPVSCRMYAWCRVLRETRGGVGGVRGVDNHHHYHQPTDDRTPKKRSCLQPRCAFLPAGIIGATPGICARWT